MKTSHSLSLKKANGTFKDLLHLWQAQPFSNNNSLTDYNELIENNPALEIMLSLGPCITWVLDIRTGKYIYVSKNIKSFLGYTADSFAKKGINNIKRLIHPDDSKLVWSQNNQSWHLILALPAAQRPGHRYNRTYRLRKANGDYICLLEQNTVLQTDAKGNVTHLFSICSDVTDLMKTNISVPFVKATIEKKRVLKTPAPEKTPKQPFLSNREREIIKLVAQGYSSKLIADQLYISFHTVNTHRRNIIEKTRSKNASGLVQFAINNRII